VSLKAPTIVSAEFAAAAGDSSQLPPPTSIELAFAGRSNVGKSSLMNRLLERKNLVRTSSTPGCTRTINFFDVRTQDGARMTMVDLPGYGYARRAKAEREAWGDLVERYLLERAGLAAVVVILDVRRPVEDTEHDLMELLSDKPRAPRPPPATIVVATKLDKLGAAARKPALAQLAKALGRPVIGFSAETGIGRDELWARLQKRLFSAETSSPDEPLRHG
jgi:GTP-binding protein